MARLYYDLHIHSSLSPCAADNMTPGNIVGMAAVKDLDVIALTDHNSCKNLPAFMEFAKRFNKIAIPGIELSTIEDVHLLGLFPTLHNAMKFGEYINHRLSDIKNNKIIFGKQEIFDENDEIVGNEEKLLINAALITIEEAHDKISSNNGIMIPAHIDKPANSLLSNLGFVPENSRFTCIEVKDKENEEEIISKNPYLKKCNIIYNSDAHYLYDISEPEHYIEVRSKTIADILETLITKK